MPRTTQNPSFNTSLRLLLLRVAASALVVHEIGVMDRPGEHGVVIIKIQIEVRCDDTRHVPPKVALEMVRLTRLPSLPRLARHATTGRRIQPGRPMLNLHPIRT